MGGQSIRASVGGWEQSISGRMGAEFLWSLSLWSLILLIVRDCLRLIVIQSKSSSLSFDSDERKFCDWKIKNYYGFCKN